VAHWILDHPRRAANARLVDIAEACGTSQPTVIRFCRRLGLDGFRDFARALTEDLSRPARFVHRDVDESDRPAEIAGKVIDSVVRTLLEQRQWLTSAPLDNAASALASARNIVFSGLGGSGQAANDALHKFFRLGIPCASVTDEPGIAQYAAIADRLDVYMLISNSGRSRALIAAAAELRRLGARTIAITDPDSPLAAGCDIVLPCHSRDDTGLYTPMNSRMAQLTVLDVLQVTTALRLGRPAAVKLESSKAALRAAVLTVPPHTG